MALAALAAQSPDEVLLVLAADHVIKDASAFHGVVQQACSAANAGHLVTFGIVPTGPETGYGYIRRGEASSGDGERFHVDSFVEKPDLIKAQAYMESGEYYWNSGMFAFTASRYLEELEKHDHEMLAGLPGCLSCR